MDSLGRSRKKACEVVGMARSTSYYTPKLPERDRPVKNRMIEIAERFPVYGSPMLHMFLKREGVVVNYKRTERIYRQSGLSHRKKRRRKKAPFPRLIFETPKSPSEIWSMDFVSDSVLGHRKLRFLTIIDHCSRVSPGIFADHSISGKKLGEFLDVIGEFKKLPKVIQVDNGPEFTSKAFLDWAHSRGISLQFITPGKPTENAFIESFNGRFRQEFLNLHLFRNLEQAREKAEIWRKEYNEIRPHSSLGGLSPNEFVKTNGFELTG